MSTLVIVGSEAHEKAATEAGAPHVIVVNPSLGGEQVMTQFLHGTNSVSGTRSTTTSSACPPNAQVCVMTWPFG